MLLGELQRHHAQAVLASMVIATQSALTTGLLPLVVMVFCVRQCPTIPSTQGSPNTDLYVFVTAEQTAYCPNANQAGTLAYSAACQRDQNDRPIFGYINFCPNSVPNTTASSAYPVALTTAMHELTHVLGACHASISLTLLVL